VFIVVLAILLIHEMGHMILLFIHAENKNVTLFFLNLELFSPIMSPKHIVLSPAHSENILEINMLQPTHYGGGSVGSEAEAHCLVVFG
jgi:hypothetical protein